jgi:alginate O-acetyltransferase complex protein AlgI
MLFPTITFAVFFLLVFIGNWLLMPRPRLWKPFILLASFVFYGWWEWRFVLLLVLSAVAVNLVLLGWFKYYGFFVTSVVNFLGVFRLNADLPLLRIVLPVGISFLTFRVLSYVVDVYRGKLRTSTMLDFAVYVAFFPYIMAGPIARASEFLPQLSGPRDPRRVDTSRAFFLIFAGLAKKMLLADYLATHIVNGVFTTPGQYTSLETLFGIVGYAVQIYCDFSAYADIAIGISLLLGFELPDNFNAPYTAISVQDFWRRWHMTLSRWLRDYLYIPLGGNRKGRTRTYVNIMITMVLGGLWHGAGWPFVFWGFLHGGAQVVEHRRVDVRTAGAPPGAPAIDTRPWGGGVWPRVGVFAFVTFAWVFFRSATFGAALSVLAQLFRSWGSVGASVTPVLLLVIAVGIGIQYVPRGVYERVEAGFSVLNPLVQGTLLAVGFMALDVLGPAGPATFLYFRF